MESIHCRNGYFTALVVLLCTTSSCFGRPSELDQLYKAWRPLELVRGLRALSVDPFDAFRSLEAIKDLDSEEALDVMRDLDVRPITIYDALSDLGIDPFDAYYALKSWLTDPLLHPSGDFYHRVNASGDPSHPYMHVSYKKTVDKDGKPKEDYKAQFMTSDEINKELSEIEKEYTNAMKEDKFKMSDFIKKAKKIHSSFDDPKHVFKDFFGKRHFQEWKNLFPEAFKSLNDIYQNPLGPSLRKDKDVNGSASYDERYKHLHGSRRRDDFKQMNPFFRSNAQGLKSHGADAFSKYKDPSRYETLQDETHVEEENAPGGGADGKTKIHHIKSFFDKKDNMYVECRKTEECAKSGQGMVRRVQSHVRHFDPQSYQNYKKTQQEQTKTATGQQQHPQQQQQQQQQQPQQQQQQQQPPPQQQPQQQQQQQQPPPQQQQYHQQQDQQQPYHQQQYHQQQPQQQQYYHQQPQQQQHYQQQPPQPQQPQHQQFNQPQQPQYNQPQQQQNYQQQPPPYQQQYNPQQQYPPNQQNTHQDHQRYHQQQKQQWKKEHQNDPTEPSYVY